MIDISLSSGIPSYYTSGDKHIARSQAFLNGIHRQETSSKKNCKEIPSNATIREEHVKCGKTLCVYCPHGPYYHAYWKENVCIILTRHV